MSNERHTRSGAGSGEDRGDGAHSNEPTAISRLADRYGIVNLGFELKQSGETLMETGRMANSAGGDRRAVILLSTRERMIELRPILNELIDKLYEQALIELGGKPIPP